MATAPPNVTRGKGLLEGFLSRRRAHAANKRIPARARAGRLLDIGCGTYPYFLMNTTFGFRVGVDQAHSSAWREPLAAGIGMVAWDGEETPSLPFRSASFDVVTMLAVAEHIEPAALHPLLREIHRVLRPAGVVVATTPPPWSNVLLKVMARTGLVSRVEIEEHAQTYTARTLKRALRAAGLADVTAGYFEMGLNVWATARK